MKKLILLSAFVVLGCSSQSGSPAPGPVTQSSVSHDCGGSSANGIAYRYCIDRAPGNIDDSEVFYFFHGIMGSEETWSSLSESAGFSQIRGGRNLPTVISISFGPAWLLAQVDHAGKPNLYDTTVKAIFPALEARLRNPVRHRTLMGQSMGGFNSLQVLARNPELFERVALLCPAFSELSPFASSDETTAYLQAHPEVNPQLVARIRTLALRTFANEKEYEAHNPRVLQMTLSSHSPRLFISAGDKDEFGFFGETNDFAARAASFGADVTYEHIVGGGHCQMTSAALASLGKFLN